MRALWKIDLNVKKAHSLNIVKKNHSDSGFRQILLCCVISDGLFSRIERLRKKENIQRFILFYNINALITISNIEDCWNQKLVSYDEKCTQATYTLTLSTRLLSRRPYAFSEWGLVSFRFILCCKVLLYKFFFIISSCCWNVYFWSNWS